MEQHHNFHRRRVSADGLHHHHKLRSSSPPPAVMWDCGSNLYDSYELSTFTQHLRRAIAAGGSSLPSASILIKDGRARSLSMPHLHFTPVLGKEKKLMADIDFSPLSKIEPLKPKTRRRLRVPKLVQRLFTRLARDGEKQHSLDSKAIRSPFERVLYTAVHYC